MRYYFDVTNGRQVLDRRGMDLPDEAAARIEAGNVADGLTSLQRGFGGRVAGGRVVVIDENGVEILAVSVPAS